MSQARPATLDEMSTHSVKLASVKRRRLIFLLDKLARDELRGSPAITAWVKTQPRRVLALDYLGGEHSAWWDRMEDAGNLDSATPMARGKTKELLQNALKQLNASTGHVLIVAAESTLTDTARIINLLASAITLFEAIYIVAPNLDNLVTDACLQQLRLEFPWPQIHGKSPRPVPLCARMCRIFCRTTFRGVGHSTELEQYRLGGVWLPQGKVPGKTHPDCDLATVKRIDIAPEPPAELVQE
ncbi:unnamed protein product, partial [Phaeothamnion confervicola]